MSRGIKRAKQHKPRQAQPMNFILLQRMSHQVGESSLELACWAAILTAFYGMLRSSNLVAKTKATFDPLKQLCMQDIVMENQAQMALIHIKWSKTIQFAQRQVVLPIFGIPHSPLCPLRAIDKLVESRAGLRGVGPQTQAFSYAKKGKLHTLTYSTLARYFAIWVRKAGAEGKKFSLHSLRRGAATLAFQANLPGELIKSHGDWASDAYLNYLSISLHQRCEVAKALTVMAGCSAVPLPPLH